MMTCTNWNLNEISRELFSPPCPEFLYPIAFRLCVHFALPEQQITNLLNGQVSSWDRSLILDLELLKWIFVLANSTAVATENV